MKKFPSFSFFLIILLFLLAHPCYPEKVKIIKDREYFPCVAEIIKNAKKSIKVIAFEMGYYPEYPTSPSNILIQELINARKRDVDVKVILEVSDWNKHLTEKNRYSGKILLKNGVKVKFDPPSITTHAKLIIVDSSVAVLGSTNWTYYSLTQNRELSLLVEIPSVVGELENYFDMLWEEKSFTD